MHDTLLGSKKVCVPCFIAMMGKNAVFASCQTAFLQQKYRLGHTKKKIFIYIFVYVRIPHQKCFQFNGPNCMY